MAAATAAPGTPQASEITTVTRRDLFDFLRDEAGSWWGRLDEITFLGRLHNLDALPSNDRRHTTTTAAEDIGQHRGGNLDWDDDWVFHDSRFQLADGPDDVLLAFLAQMAHPLVQPDAAQATNLITRLNALLAPDGWELRTSGFISGRPVYSAARTPTAPGRMLRLEIKGDDAGELDFVLGQVCHLPGASGDARAHDLLVAVRLTLRPDGGYYNPTPGDNWTEASSEAVLTVGPGLMAEFSSEVKDRIWTALTTVLAHHGRDEVLSLVVEPASPRLPWSLSPRRRRCLPLRPTGVSKPLRQPSGKRRATRPGASAPRVATPKRTASSSAVEPIASATRSSKSSSTTLSPCAPSPCCRCQARSFVTQACERRTSS
ncbi:hypothetical protein AB1484_20215 [Parafrankia sp. FMc6]|uniref:AbiJ-related protein n=1 Tax=Parafrankia soli TaxID=2599596 RepID=UPI0034D52B60